MLVGIEGDDGIIYYSTAEARNRQQQEGRCRIGACFTPPERDLLRPSNLLPTLQPSNHHLATGLPAEILQQWVEIGVLQPFLVDQLLLCPKCHALPTFRRMCRHCGSVQIVKTELLRHFACAHVGPAEDFKNGDELACPKCRAHNLVMHADVGWLQGPYRCLDCNRSRAELETVGICLACHGRFALHEAWEEKLIGYNVNRLMEW
jgi:hypothetical protein